MKYTTFYTPQEKKPQNIFNIRKIKNQQTNKIRSLYCHEKAFLWRWFSVWIHVKSHKRAVRKEMIWPTAQTVLQQHCTKVRLMCVSHMHSYCLVQKSKIIFTLQTKCWKNWKLISKTLFGYVLDLPELLRIANLCSRHRHSARVWWLRPFASSIFINPQLKRTLSATHNVSADILIYFFICRLWINSNQWWGSCPLSLHWRPTVDLQTIRLIRNSLNSTLSLDIIEFIVLVSAWS